MLHKLPNDTADTVKYQPPSVKSTTNLVSDCTGNPQELQGSKQEFDTLLAAVKRMSRRHTDSSSLLGILLLAAVINYHVLFHVPGLKFIVDYSLTFARLTSRGVGLRPEVTVNLALPLILMTFGTGLFAAVYRRKRLKLIRSLAQYGDVRAKGPLIDSLFLLDRGVRAESIEALKRLLPLIKPQDSAAISDDQRGRFHTYFAQAAQNPTRQDPNLTLAISKALAVIGDDTIAIYVSRLANLKTENPDWVMVRAAAQQHLDRLNTKDIRQKEARTLLLRSAAGVSNPRSTLLRSVEDSGSDPEELLRSSKSD